MMRTSPFEHKLSMEEAEDRLIKNLKKIIGQKKDFYKLIGEQFGDGDQVTMQMKTIRNCSLSERIKTYSSQRIEDQRKWYLKKTKGNRKGKNIVFIILIGLQIIAFCSIIAEINDAISIFLMPFLACLTASTIAFLQLKRFQELTESYAITATELGLIKSKFHHIKSEDDLQNFVDDAETAVSREHTLWLARRDSTELFD